MNMNDISVGDTVEVFQKPFTKEQHEGFATVKEVIRSYDTHADVVVEFDDEPGEQFIRTIVDN